MTWPSGPAQFRGQEAPPWTLILDRPRGGLENMAIDRRLLEDLNADRQPRSVLRLYSWSEPTVSVGKLQRLERAADLQACARRGVPVVRRPTGGRAVLHAAELTYAVLSNDQELFSGRDVLGTYRSVAAALQRALQTVGADCRLARPPGGKQRRVPHQDDPNLNPREVPGHSSSPSTAPGLQTPCFTAPNRYELLVGDRKVAGSAQRRLRRAFLQHGSIPLEVDYPLMAELLGSDPLVLRRSLVSVSQAAGRQVSFPQLSRAMAEAFQETFGGCWKQRR